VSPALGDERNSDGSAAEVLLVADRPLRLLPAIPFGGKHETESGHLDSAVDTAAMPWPQESRRARRDDCIARTMRKPDRTKFPTVAALLLSSNLRLLVRHASSNRAPPNLILADGVMAGQRGANSPSSAVISCPPREPDKRIFLVRR
jgi:hypothetical protein